MMGSMIKDVINFLQLLILVLLGFAGAPTTLSLRTTYYVLRTAYLVLRSTRLLAYSLTRLLTYSLTHLLTYSLTHFLLIKVRSRRSSPPTRRTRSSTPAQRACARISWGPPHPSARCARARVPTSHPIRSLGHGAGVGAGVGAGEWPCLASSRPLDATQVLKILFEGSLLGDSPFITCASYGYSL